MELSSQGNICPFLKPNCIVVIVSGDVTYVTYLKPLLLIDPKREQDFLNMGTIFLLGAFILHV